MAEPSQPSGESTGPTDYVPKKSGTSWTVAIVLLVVGLVIGGAVGYFAAPRPSGVEPLVVIGPWAGSEMDAFLPVLDAFTASTGIPVTYRIFRQEALQVLLPTQFDARQAPADVIFMVSSFIQSEGPKGHIVDVSDIVTPSNFAVGATTGAQLLAPVTSGGTIYGGAYTGKVKPGFWYRQSFFDQHSLTPPTTWAEFETLLQTIDALPGVAEPIVSGDGVGWPLSDVTEHFIATYGGASMHRALNGNQTTATKSWTDADVRTVFADRLVPLLAANRFSDLKTADQTALLDWWNGQHALYFMGTWIPHWILALDLSPAPDLNDLRAFPLPSVSGITPGIVFGADYMFVPTYTSRLDDAKRLFSFLLSVEGQSAQVAEGGHLATRVGVPDSAYAPGDRAVAQSLAGKEVLTDLDDSIGGTFQSTFWSQLQGIWTSNDPVGDLDGVLAAIDAAVPP